jgi:hypothetical protein
MPSLWTKVAFFNNENIQCSLEVNTLSTYLYLYRPGKVADIHIECNIRVASKVKFFIGKTISVFLYISLGNNRSLFPRYCST